GYRSTTSRRRSGSLFRSLPRGCAPALGGARAAIRTFSHRPELAHIMKLQFDLNSDLGEGAGHDAELFELISSANIAIDVHAGDSDTMHAAVCAAKEHSVAVGAHPSFF